MTTSPYDTLPTGKQALAPTSGESIEEKPSITGNPAAPADPLPSAKAPNPITDPYGGYEEISLEEAARLATPVISQSQDSGSSPTANRNSGDPGSAKPAASQPASAPDTAMKKYSLPHQLALTPNLATSILPAIPAVQALPAGLYLCQIPAIPALPAVLHLCQPNPC